MLRSSLTLHCMYLRHQWRSLSTWTETIRQRYSVYQNANGTFLSSICEQQGIWHCARNGHGTQTWNMFTVRLRLHPWFYGSVRGQLALIPLINA